MPSCSWRRNTIPALACSRERPFLPGGGVALQTCCLRNLWRRRGGSLGAGMVKPILTALRMMPIPECVSVPMIWNQLSDGVFQASDQNRSAAATLLAELHRWAGALKPSGADAATAGL